MAVKSRKNQLIQRLRRVRGQLNAVETALTEDRKLTSILQTLSACHGAIHSLKGELIQDYIRTSGLHLKENLTTEQTEMLQDLVTIVKTFVH